MLAAFILVALNGYCRHILTKKKEYTVKMQKCKEMNAVMRFHVEISMSLDAFIPVLDALRCRFSQPWGFSCNDPQDQLRFQTSLRHPRRIYHPAAHKYDFQLQQRAIKLCAG